MKNIFSILAIAVSSMSFSQVIIGDDIGTVLPATQKTSVLLEFALGQNKGIILPYVRTVPSGTGLVEGTIILDASDATKAKVKYYNGVISTDTPTGWFDLSNTHEANISTETSMLCFDAMFFSVLIVKSFFPSSYSRYTTGSIPHDEANSSVVISKASRRPFRR